MPLDRHLHESKYLLQFRIFLLCDMYVIFCYSVVPLLLYQSPVPWYGRLFVYSTATAHPMVPGLIQRQAIYRVTK